MWYNAQGQQAPDAAWMVINDERVQVQNPSAIVSWREAHGYIYSERPPQPIPEPEPIDTTDFDAACAQFRDICYIIRQAIGDPDFRGGFEEMVKLQQAPIYNTIEGLQLANAWSALNDLCTYEGKKIGLGQPEWWHTCWEQVAPQPEPEEPTTPDTEDLQIEEHIEETPVEAPGSEPDEPESEPVDVPVAELPDEPETTLEPPEPIEPAIEEEESSIEFPTPEPEPEDTPANSEPAPPMPEPVAVPEDTAADTPQEDPIEIPEEPVNTQEGPEETAGQEA